MDEKQSAIPNGCPAISVADVAENVAYVDFNYLGI